MPAHILKICTPQTAYVFCSKIIRKQLLKKSYVNCFIAGTSHASVFNGQHAFTLGSSEKTDGFLWSKLYSNCTYLAFDNYKML